MLNRFPPFFVDIQKLTRDTVGPNFITIAAIFLAGICTHYVGKFELFRHGGYLLPSLSGLWWIDGTGFLGAFYTASFGPFWLISALSLIYWPFAEANYTFERCGLYFIFLFVFFISEFCWKYFNPNHFFAGILGIALGGIVGLAVGCNLKGDQIWWGRLLVVPSVLAPALCVVLGAISATNSIFNGALIWWAESAY